MKTLKFAGLLLFLSLFAGVMDATSQDAQAILDNVDKIIFSPKDRQGKVTMVLTDKTGKEKIREATMLQKGYYKKLYRYTKPESQAGIATLSLSNDVMWLYMPAFEKPKKISMLAKGDAFNGTDFSFEDMATTPYSDRYVPFLLESKEDVYILKLMPKSKKSGYSQIIASISKSFGYPIKMEYFNGQGKKIKEAAYRYEKVGKYWSTAEVNMKDLEKNHSTKILLTNVKFDQDLSDELFTVEKLMPKRIQKAKKDTIN